MNNVFDTQSVIAGADALASIFGAGSDNVLMPKTIDKEAEDQASRVLKNETLDKVLDGAKAKVDEDKAKSKEIVDTPIEVPEKVSVDTTKAKEVLDLAINELNKVELEIPVEVSDKAGRPKIEKDVMVSYLKDMIEANTYGLPNDIEYDSTKQSLEDVLSKLSKDQLYNVLNANRKSEIDEIRNQTPQEFFESLPESIQYIGTAFANGAGEDDLQNIYKALLRVEQVKTLDPKNEEDQAIIARSYLQATRFGTEDKIAEQIEEWKETDKLGKKSADFKPLLDDLQKEQVQAQLKVVEAQRVQNEQLAAFYTDNVYKTLEKNELAGIKLDKKFARAVADNMTSTVAGPYTGRPVNWLGYGLEQAQYTKPDYEAVMLAAWILNDKSAALEALGQRGKNIQVEKDAKLIKLNQGLGKVGGEQVQTQEPQKIKRINTSNVLKRTTLV